MITNDCLFQTLLQQYRTVAWIRPSANDAGFLRLDDKTVKDEETRSFSLDEFCAFFLTHYNIHERDLPRLQSALSARELKKSVETSSDHTLAVLRI